MERLRWHCVRAGIAVALVGFAAHAGAGGDPALAAAAAKLVPGASVDFTPEPAMNEADYAWQTRGVYDAARQVVHVLGKPANANKAWLHVMYDVARDRWTPVRNIGVESPGHVYGNLALDPATGDLYLGVYSKRIQRYDQASGRWTQLAVDISTDAIQGHFNGLAWHPDLYGPGDGGVVVQEVDRLHLWRKANDRTETVRTERVGANAGDGIYFAALGKTVTGRERHVLVAAHADGKPRVEWGGEPPIPTGGLSELYHLPFGVMVQHPADPAQLLLLERQGDFRVWSTRDGIAWVQRNHRHPFQDQATYVLVSLPAYQVIWAVGSQRDSRLRLSKLWKLPAD